MAEDWRKLARHYAQINGFDPDVFERQMGQEAHGQDLTSPAGAQGPAQIMPATARAWGVKNVHDIHEAYNAAAREMAKYQHQFGNVKDALIAYNAGPGRVGGTLPSETQDYIKTIMGGSGATHSGAQASVQQATAGTPTPTGSGTGNVFDFLASTTPTANPLQAQLQQGWQLLSRLQNQQAPSAEASIGASATEGAMPTSGGGNSSLQSVLDQANAIDQKNNQGKLPYLWGGGHQATATAPDSPITPLDCSGAVSRALGVDPRVSGQFAKWGESGEGKNVTIYANDEHVLMKINGHFWGTSKSNPGGGAGWIPQSAISADYLKRFNVRHPPGM